MSRSAQAGSAAPSSGTSGSAMRAAQPVLVGTIAVETSEFLSEMLN